jgi:hypothetical protein
LSTNQRLRQLRTWLPCLVSQPPFSVGASGRSVASPRAQDTAASSAAEGACAPQEEGVVAAAVQAAALVWEVACALDGVCALVVSPADGVLS